MPRASAIQTAFNAGEWSPRMGGRVDLPGWAAACETLLNFTVTAEGPASHRGGTYFVAATKDPLKKSRLVAFRFSIVQAYILEFGDQYIRFYKDYGQILSGSPAAAVEIATPYLEADLAALRFTQSADTLYVLHSGYATAKLVRSSHVDWTLSSINFAPPATDEDGYTPTGIALTLGATSGTGVAVTAGASIFLAADVGRQIRLGINAAAGLATITAVGSATGATVDVVNAFPSTSIAAGSWTLTGSPVTGCTPSAKAPIGATATLTLAAAGWRAIDVGRYVNVNGGFLRITEYSSGTSVKARILRALDNATGTSEAAGGTWTLLDPAWSANKGYPTCATFFQQRLFLGGSQAKPTTFWGSVTGDFENFAKGGDDDAAVEFTLDTDQVNAIQWLAATRGLLIGTTGAEFLAAGSTSKPKITPDNIQVTPQSARGSAALPALLVGNVLMFVQRSRRKVRQYRYSYADDAYVSPDVTLKARHVPASGIVDLAYAQEPEGVLWAARTDGLLIGLTFDDDEQVVGWHRHCLGGQFGAGKAVVESVAVIPSPDGERDDLWLQVKRTVNGQTFRSIEWLTPGLSDEQDPADGYFVDCGLTYDGAPADSIGGLDHLIGETVALVCDGASHPDRVVALDGTVALDSEYAKVHVGLYAIARLKPMPIEAAAEDGVAQGKIKRIEKVTVRFLRTAGGRLVARDDFGRELTERIPFRTTNDALGAAVPLFTGDKPIANPGGWETAGQVEYIQDRPLPATVVAVVSDVATNKI